MTETKIPEFYCIACNGLDEFAVGQPVEALAAYLNARTPKGIHFNVVGGVDPMLEQTDIFGNALAAAKRGAVLILIGHSKGAMMMFYLADWLKAQGYRVALVIALDATCWGSNMPGTTPWAVIIGENAGKWLAPDNVDDFRYFRQPGYPGGGYAYPAPGNHTSNLKIYERMESHVALPDSPPVETMILAAVEKTMAAHGLGS